MNLRKKINFTMIPLVLCLILLISATYAWLTMSVAPEVTTVDTNIGANGSLEIALLSDETYVDPLTIRTTVGSSAVNQDAVKSNLFWGNVIELRDESYGINQISLLPSRLNLMVTNVVPYRYAVSNNPLKIAQFGKDGRISMLTDTTASAVYENQNFTYYTNHQRYGVRAIGTISNLTPQQLALASARTEAQSHTAAAIRAVKNVWRENGNGIMEYFWSRQVEHDGYSREDVVTLKAAALQLQEALEHIDLAMRQGLIGLAASMMSEEGDFEMACGILNNRNIALSSMLTMGNIPYPKYTDSYIRKLDNMKARTEALINNCNTILKEENWGEVFYIYSELIDENGIAAGDVWLSEDGAIRGLSDGDMLIMTMDTFLVSEISEFIGNYSTYFQWERVGSLGVGTTYSPDDEWLETGCYLDTVLQSLEGYTAAAGNWTKANLNDTYAMAIDMAFRCNVGSDLLLQTTPAMRTGETAEFPVTQGGGSYMRFTSTEMDTEALLKLMDTIRVGFLNQRNDLVSVAKLDTAQYELHEEGVFAPLYLYEYSLLDTGALAIGNRLDEREGILPLTKNVPSVVTVVIWLDGDHVDNSMVGHSASRSMTGVLNLQFSSSADLKPLNLPIKNGK